MIERVWPKRIVVDANFLVALLNPALDSESRLRINSFVSQIEKQGCSIIIPMPVMAEYLVGADQAALKSMQILERKKFVIMANFDRTSAYECAQLDRSARSGGKDKRDGVEQPWQKIKLDRQVLAVGKAQGATLVISRDAGVQSSAARCGIECLWINDLGLAAEDQQLALLPTE